MSDVDGRGSARAAHPSGRSGVSSGSNALVPARQAAPYPSRDGAARSRRDGALGPRRLSGSRLGSDSGGGSRTHRLGSGVGSGAARAPRRDRLGLGFRLVFGRGAGLGLGRRSRFRRGFRHRLGDRLGLGVASGTGRQGGRGSARGVGFGAAARWAAGAVGLGSGSADALELGRRPGGVDRVTGRGLAAGRRRGR